MDVFSRAEVKASHILIKVDAKAKPEEKEKARQKLLAIKKEIASGKISFADAANKYSEDEGNKEQPSGGNLGFFPRKGVFIEPFAKAAFAMKEGEISDPIETEYGLHLIYVVQKKPGETVAFSEDLKPYILEAFADELQDKLKESERKTAKIEIKPMPPDLFRLIPKGPVGDPVQQPGTNQPAAKDAARKGDKAK
jgi:peptidyl-prolyl cis-trans isomerase C